MAVDNHFRVSGVSRPGRRPENEDAACWEVLGGLGGVRGFVAVCDGMGGHNAGEVASAIALKSFEGEIRGLANRPALPLAELRADVERWVLDANQEIRRKGAADSRLRGMGTTMALALACDDGSLLVANVGDSRIFLVRGVTVSQLSTDHTALAEQRRFLGSESSAPEDSAGNPFAHALTRSLGQEERTLPDVNIEEKLLPGDLVIVTSDGVTDVLESERFLSIIEASKTLDEVTERIYQTAYDEGSKDNITVGVLANGRPARLGSGIGRAPSPEDQILDARPVDSTMPLVRVRSSGVHVRPDSGYPSDPVQVVHRVSPPARTKVSIFVVLGATGFLLLGIAITLLLTRRPSSSRDHPPRDPTRTLPAPTAELVVPTRGAPLRQDPTEVVREIGTAPIPTPIALVPTVEHPIVRPLEMPRATEVPASLPTTPVPTAPEPQPSVTAAATSPAEPTAGTVPVAELEVPLRDASVRASSAVVSGQSLFMKVEFDRPVSFERGAKVLLKRLGVHGERKALLPGPAGIRIERTDSRTVSWRLNAGRIEEARGRPIEAGEVLDATIAFGDQQLDLTLPVGRDAGGR